MANASRVPSWSIWMVLAGLAILHLVLDTFFLPVGPPQRYPPSMWSFAWHLGRAGILLSQPVLLAMVVVFWPGQKTYRVFAIAAALLVLLIFAVRSGEPRYIALGPHLPFLLVAEFFVAQIPLTVARRMRGWQIVGPRVERTSPVHGRFSVRDLFLLTSGAAVLLALGRWVFSPASWQIEFSNPFGLWLGILMYFAIGCTATPLLPLVLAVNRRSEKWLLSIVSAILVPVAAALLMSWLDAKSPPLWVWFVAILSTALGGYFSVIMGLLAVRACGYRLARDGRGEPACGTVALQPQPDAVEVRWEVR